MRVEPSGAGLPSSASRLLGRSAEASLICKQLTSGTVRLLTLAGLGGIGKTRLALEVARIAQIDFADGARFVELAPLREPALVLSAIHAAIHSSRPPGRRQALDALKQSLGRRHLLLVLDNFEQVLEAAPLVSELLAACPTLSVLATSRAPLRLTWEHVFTVGPLDVPPADFARRPDELLDYASVALLAERMAVAGPRDRWQADDLVAMAAICRRLEGIPLALELAAARAKVLKPTALLARLERPLELLTNGPRDTPARHQTLRKTFEWSYELLEDADRRLFRQLGAFVGGCTLDAAARVSDIPAWQDIRFVDALGRLIDCGLVCRVDHGSDTEWRLILLEPVREYALEKLAACGETDAVLQRHAITYLEFGELADQHMRGPEEREWLPQLEREHGNLLVALRWFIDHADTERSLRMGAALCMFWWVCGFTHEGLERVEEALALPAPEPPEPAISMARAHALSLAGALMFWHGEFEAADAYQHAALALLDNGGDLRRRGFALINLGNAALARRDLDRAERLYERSLQSYRAAADVRGSAHALMCMGLVAFHRQNYDQACVLLTESVPTLQAVGDARSAVFGLRDLAIIHCYRAEFDAAQACLREGLSLWRQVQGRVLLPFLLEASAMVAAVSGDFIRGLKIAGGAAALREQMEIPVHPVWTPQLTRWLDRARVAVGSIASSRAWAEGLALSVEDSVAEALAVGCRDEADGGPRAGASVGLNGSTSADEALPGGLTRREAEVLRMVAGGLTNKEIASHLSLSIATVERHVANVYTKIGAHGRARATEFAILRGLRSPARD